MSQKLLDWGKQLSFLLFPAQNCFFRSTPLILSNALGDFKASSLIFCVRPLKHAESTCAKLFAHDCYSVTTYHASKAISCGFIAQGFGSNFKI